MKTSKKIKIAITVSIFILFALFLHHMLPRTAVVQITGTDVKRVDKSSGKVIDERAVENKKEKVFKTYDVRFINSMKGNGKPMVFRNEDTGWGWPPYFKFDSADLTAQAQALATHQEKPWVLVKYYGWRIRIFSMFPNAVKLKEVNRDYTHFPLFNLFFIAVLLASGFFIRRQLKMVVDRIRNRKTSDP